MSGPMIVMYHYVRDLKRSRYPEIKGLNTAEFEQQLDWITQLYTVCSTRDVIAASRGQHALPSNACLLTFDDGLIDHFTVVFPRLVERGLTASFYPPAVAARQERVLDTHKIHFILAAAAPHYGALAQRVRALIDARHGEPGVAAADTLWLEWARPSRFDPPEVAFVKQVLQKELPEPVRAAITATLFEEFVGIEEGTFARELYMDVHQLRCLIANGMEVGGHGAAHLWLHKLSPEGQRAEIEATAVFLREVYGRQPVDWVMCYPFGRSTPETLALLPRVGCALGLTTGFVVAPDLASPLELTRLDTNQLPPRGDAPVATSKAADAVDAPR